MDERGIVRGTGEGGRDDVLPAQREGAGVQLSAGKAEVADGGGKAGDGTVYGGAEELAVWDVAAREAGKVRGDALFHALNGGCIRPGEGVWAWSAFSFAAGSLDKAAGVEAQREGWEVELSWEAADYSRKAGAGDAVYVGYFYAGMGRTPGLVRAEGARREDCRARVAVPDGGMPEGTALHLYLFFGNKAGTRFSPSVYVAT